MKKLILLFLIALNVLSTNATNWVINFAGFGTGGQIGNPTCSNVDMSYGGSFRVVDELNSSTNYPNGTNIKWYKIGSGCSGTIIYTGHPYFISNVPLTTTTYYAKLPTGECLSYTLTVYNPVAPAGAISGLSIICSGQDSVTYTVPIIANATSYVWSLPSGVTGTSSTNTITVNYSYNASSGNITVKGRSNYCGDGASSNLAVTVNPYPYYKSISDVWLQNIAVCPGNIAGTGGVQLVLMPRHIYNSTTVTWNLPNGITISPSGLDNIWNINCSSNAQSGTITMTAINSCGQTILTAPITVNHAPNNTGLITGLSTVCKGQNSVIYTVSAIANATSYTWTLPSGAIGSSTTDSISVNYGYSAISGNITVNGTNTCGNGATSSYAVTVNSLPAAAGTITGTANVCKGQNSVTYTVPTIANATSYVWTLPSGATGTSTTNSISVSYGTSAVSGSISVKGANTCGNGATSTYAIIVINKPASPIISLNGYVLHSDAISGNQWYDQNGFINGAINQDYTVNVNGNYYVIVTLLGCSSDASNVLNVILTGIEVAENNKTIKVYPNPVSNELIIEIEGNNGKLNFEILNAIGQVVFKGNLVGKTTVQTSNFAPGVYLIKLENGKTFEFKKIIKE